MSEALKCYVALMIVGWLDGTQGVALGCQGQLGHLFEMASCPGWEGLEAGWYLGGAGGQSGAENRAGQAGRGCATWFGGKGQDARYVDIVPTCSHS